MPEAGRPVDTRSRPACTERRSAVTEPPPPLLLLDPSILAAGSAADTRTRSLCVRCAVAGQPVRRGWPATESECVQGLQEERI